VADVGDELQRCTSDVKHFTIKHHQDPTRQVIFVDTPGFNADGVWLDDKKILQEILDWLQTS
jgi:GTPase Era involved in 16S rRNA processing